MVSVMEWMKAVYGTAGVQEAWGEFTLDDDSPSPVRDAVPALHAAVKHHQLFWPWCLSQWMPGVVTDTKLSDRALHGVVPAQVYLDLHSAVESPRRMYLDACVKTPVRSHEVVGGDRQRGFDTRELITQRECSGVQLSYTHPAALAVSDIVYAQVVQAGLSVRFEACAPVAFSGDCRDGLLRRLRRVMDGYRDMKLRSIFFDLAAVELSRMP